MFRFLVRDIISAECKDVGGLEARSKLKTSRSQMGDMMCLDTDEVGWHDRDIPYKILLLDAPLLLKGV